MKSVQTNTPANTGAGAHTTRKGTDTMNRNAIGTEIITEIVAIDTILNTARTLDPIDDNRANWLRETADEMIEALCDDRQLTEEQGEALYDYLRVLDFPTIDWATIVGIVYEAPAETPVTGPTATAVMYQAVRACTHVQRAHEHGTSTPFPGDDFDTVLRGFSAIDGLSARQVEQIVGVVSGADYRTGLDWPALLDVLSA